jgi:alkanesulfonate monooxygenase SsuD/methylene tetrahydromethanopterin reductase-like flavin-dependent oxidoreductase (luciferase family)
MATRWWTCALLAGVHDSGGERTAQVVLGTNVLTATFRYNPAVSAKAFATMACLCPDRVVLGLGGKG